MRLMAVPRSLAHSRRWFREAGGAAIVTDEGVQGLRGVGGPRRPPEADADAGGQTGDAATGWNDALRHGERELRGPVVPHGEGIRPSGDAIPFEPAP